MHLIKHNFFTHLLQLLLGYNMITRRVAGIPQSIFRYYVVNTVTYCIFSHVVRESYLSNEIIPVLCYVRIFNTIQTKFKHIFNHI